MPRNGPKLNDHGRFRGVTRRRNVVALRGRDVRMWNMKLSQRWTNGPLTLTERKIRDVFHKALACLESEHQGTSSNPLAFALPGEKEEIIRSLRAARTSRGRSSWSSRWESRWTKIDSIEPPQRHYFSATSCRPRVLMKAW
jgi:hypothetical protein